MGDLLGLLPWWVWFWLVMAGIGWVFTQIVKSPAGPAIGKGILSWLLK